MCGGCRGESNNNSLPTAYRASVADKQDSALGLNGSTILSSICIDFQIPSCSISELYLCYKKSWAASVVSLPSNLFILQLFCSLFLFLAIGCTELLWKSAAAGEGWTCLEMAATKARLSSITRPLNLLWEYLKLPLSDLQREVQGEAVAPLTQTGIASPPVLPALGWSSALFCPNLLVKITATTVT